MGCLLLYLSCKTTVNITLGIFTYISVQCKFLLCLLILPMMKPSKNNAVTTTIHQIHRSSLLSFFMFECFPEASTRWLCRANSQRVICSSSPLWGRGRVRLKGGVGERGVECKKKKVAVSEKLERNTMREIVMSAIWPVALWLGTLIFPVLTQYYET